MLEDQHPDSALADQHKQEEERRVSEKNTLFSTVGSGDLAMIKWHIFISCMS